MAPWTHTYLSPQTERRLCCASREPAQSFTQYIDTAEGDNEYTPETLEEYWNGAGIRSIRKQMLNNEVPDACQVCDKKLLNQDVYRDYFTHLFNHKWDEVIPSTDADGYTTMKPVSWTIVLVIYVILNVVCVDLCLVVVGKQKLASKAK